MNKNKTKTFNNRVLVLALAMLLAVISLTSCSSNTVTLTVGPINRDSSVNSMTGEEFDQVANMLASVYSSTYDTQEMLVAASRGYDMTLEGFDDSKIDPSENKGMNLEAAKNVITAANEKSTAGYRVDPAIYADLNEADVNTLISCFKTTVNVDQSKGFFDVILTAIGTVVRWLTNTLCFGSYLAGICVFAVIIEILMLPFAIKQQKNSIRQAKLRPKEMAIRNKYKGRNDQVTTQKMQQEIQELYQKENVSPYGGCLPLLIQMPIIIALYNIVIDPLRYVLGQASTLSPALTTYYTTARAAGGAGMTLSGNGGTISILSAIKEGHLSLEGLKDFAFFSNGDAVYESINSVAGSIPNFTVGGVNFGLNPDFANFNILLLVPVLIFVAYFFTTKLSRKFTYQPATNDGPDARQVACSNNMMDFTMPAMSTFFSFMVPALVGVYWIFRSLINLLKQFIISRLMPMPVFTEEDYKAAAREMSGKQQRAPKHTEKKVGTVRSLHYIDDEDFDDTRERGLARKAAIEERARREQEQKANKTPFGAVPMKEERKNEKKKDADSENPSDQTNDTENNTQE